MQITTVGIDLAKNVFQIHGADSRGKAVLRKRLRRDQCAAFVGNLPPCLVGMEACGGAHHWARRLETFRHTVKLMAPQFVKSYVKGNKTDMADAEAICEAVVRPSMRFVSIKNIEQQSVLALHRVRQGFVKARTAQGNQIRGLLAEFGLVVPQGIVGSEVVADGPLKLDGAAMSAPADLPLGERGQPTLDLIEPGRRGRGEVRMEARMAGHPGFDRRGLMGAVIVHHQMHVKLGRCGLIDGAQEGEELLGPVPPMHLADEFTRGDVTNQYLT